MLKGGFTTPTSIRPATGTRIGSGALGAWISNPGGSVSFSHPWKPVLVLPSKGEFGLRFQRGVVDGREPKIKGTPMSGAVGVNAPILPIRYGEANTATNESWAVLEVTPNAKGMLDDTSLLQIVHSSNTTGSEGATKGRIALACIQWKDAAPCRVWPVVFFNLKYTRTGSAETAWKHWFL